MVPPHYTPITTYRTIHGDEVESIEYKGFHIKRQNEHVLWYIDPDEGMLLPSALQGNFTKIPSLYEAIDKWLQDYGLSASSLITTKPTSTPRYNAKDLFDD